MINGNEPILKPLWRWTVKSVLLLGLFAALQQDSIGQSDGAADEPVDSGSENGSSGQEKDRSKAEKPEKAIRIPLEGDDRFTKSGVEYRKHWGFKAGVARLYPPLYSGWENGMEVKGLHEEYAAKGEAGYTLSSIFYNQRYFRETGSEFVNNFVLLWVPERYAFSVLKRDSAGVFPANKAMT